jgi:hypothetical protein
MLTDVEKQEKIINQLNKENLITDKDNSKELYEAEQTKIGLLFTVTTIMKDIGYLADAKMNATVTQAVKFPVIKQIIETKQHNAPEHKLTDSFVKNNIEHFLKGLFSFDPSIHIRSGHDKDKIKTEIIDLLGKQIQVDPDDPGHLTLETLKSKVEPLDKDKEIVNTLFTSRSTLNSALCILRDENLHDPIRYMLNNVEQFKYYLMPLSTLVMNHIPPQDTFHRWNYFTEVNYEELRTITETLYPERPDLDWAIAIWTSFKGTDEEIEEQFNNYCQKHQDEMLSVMKTLEFGKWSLLADFKENRKNIHFYNKHTEVLKKIIDRHTEDKKIGTELMRNRVRQVKAKNIAESGPDAPGLKTYKNTMSTDGKDLSSKGVERVISPEEMKRLEKAQGSIKAAKELEVLEEYEKLIQDLDSVKKYRELTTEENDRYNRAVEALARAKEMINVPDDAIQVDVFTTNTKTGEFSKSHFYTKCDEALEEESKRVV